MPPQPQPQPQPLLPDLSALRTGAPFRLCGSDRLHGDCAAYELLKAAQKYGVRPFETMAVRDQFLGKDFVSENAVLAAVRDARIMDMFIEDATKLLPMLDPDSGTFLSLMKLISELNLALRMGCDERETLCADAYGALRDPSDDRRALWNAIGYMQGVYDIRKILTRS